MRASIPARERFRQGGAICGGSLFLAALLGLAGAVFAAPRPPRAPAKAPAAETPATSAPVHAGETEFADSFPTARKPAADLQLDRDDERQGDSLAAFAIGMLAEDNSEADTALERFRQAFDLQPANPELAVKLAYLYAQRNDAPTGIQVLKDAVKASPKAPLPLIFLSQLYSKYLKKPEPALRYASTLR